MGRPVIIVDESDRGRVGDLEIRMSHGRALTLEGVGRDTAVAVSDALGKKRAANVHLGLIDGTRVTVNAAHVGFVSWVPKAD